MTYYVWIVKLKQWREIGVTDFYFLQTSNGGNYGFKQLLAENSQLKITIRLK
jgi:hypothetical protein